MRAIQRNACCLLSSARDLVLAAYLPDICSVSLTVVIESRVNTYYFISIA